MPELPEVETVRRGMEPVLRGRRIQGVIVRRGDLRRRVPKNFKDRVAGRVAAEILRRGKYIVVMLEGGGGFVLHLGMSGRIKIRKADSGEDYATHDHVVFVLENRTEIIFNDPRRFGMVFPVDTDWEKETPFSEMGPEPLEKKFTARVLHEKIKNKNATIKSSLLDQHVVAGVGNIYACEALYYAGISPEKISAALSMAEVSLLVKAIRHVLTLAIKAGGSTLRDHRQTDGSAGYFQHSFSVYDREGEPCPSCDCKGRGGVRRVQQGGRSTFYCAEKQR